ncbi:MAG: MrcB family domain-containing protein [Pseudobacter sp.]|uniref:MrcB family domain-containing protein n=1 Tax=Pseudobacter sp. TaxID=2045420 RepID=UPI003F81A0CB
MALPKNLTKDNLLFAIDKIDKEGIPANAESLFYDVIHNGKAYPPKLIVSYANIPANGFELDRNTFPGGNNTPCFKLLQKSGFQIVPKKSIYPLLTSFVSRVQNDPTNLKKKDFSDDYQGFKIETSFGQGNQATIPWIAFLGKNQKVSTGIYPVYLYYKEQQILILAFGVSETNMPLNQWNVSTQTIEGYFNENYSSTKPKRYGSSYYFASYNIDPSKPNFGLNKSKVDIDLQRILELYKSTLAQQPVNTIKVELKHSLPREKFNYNDFVSHLNDAGLLFPELVIRRFISSLVAKPFVILTGLSGSGKTKLALAFSKWIARERDQICMVAVGADWTNREPLLGFPNMLEKNKYIFPESGALNLIFSALENPDKPYFLILDEMNLSHVERYFADFLSCMESGEQIKLHPDKESWNGGTIPSAFYLPSNLFIIGTVNIDETTYMFSPKVLDRSSVIEFRISKADMGHFLSRNSVADIKKLEGKGANMAEEFIELTRKTNIQSILSKDLKSDLLKFFEVLQEAGAEFGYRSAHEIQLYERATSFIGNWKEHEIMDSIIMQKLLPRVHGSRRKLEGPLKNLIQLCLVDDEAVDDYLKAPIPAPRPEKVKYKIALEKAQRMYQSLIANSFCSYAEA